MNPTPQDREGTRRQDSRVIEAPGKPWQRRIELSTFLGKDWVTHVEWGKGPELHALPTRSLCGSDPGGPRGGCHQDRTAERGVGTALVRRRSVPERGQRLLSPQRTQPAQSERGS